MDHPKIFGHAKSKLPTLQVNCLVLRKDVREDVQDYAGTIIHLQALTPNGCIRRVRHLKAGREAERTDHNRLGILASNLADPDGHGRKSLRGEALSVCPLVLKSISMRTTSHEIRSWKKHKPLA